MERLTVEVYRHNAWGDCTNHGVTSRHDQMLLLWDCRREDAVAYCKEKGIDMDGCLWLKPRELWGEDHSMAIPLIHESGKCGPMFGGNFVYTSDSRLYKLNGLTCAVPIAVHDRYETERDYASYND